jgi:hypothetical protein
MLASAVPPRCRLDLTVVKGMGDQVSCVIVSSEKADRIISRKEMIFIRHAGRIACGSRHDAIGTTAHVSTLLNSCTYRHDSAGNAAAMEQAMCKTTEIDRCNRAGVRPVIARKRLVAAGRD